MFQTPPSPRALKAPACVSNLTNPAHFLTWNRYVLVMAAGQLDPRNSTAKGAIPVSSQASAPCQCHDITSKYHIHPCLANR